jgi:TonB family protein
VPKPPAPEKVPALPEAPKLAAAPDLKPLPIDLKGPRAVRRFTPPAVPKPPAPEKVPALPEAPKLAAAPELKPLPIDLKGPRAVRRFTPPAAPKPSTPEKAPSLPEAPKLEAVPELKPLPIDLKGPRAVRRFTPPAVPERPAPEKAPSLPEAPKLAAAEADRTAATALPSVPRRFVAPPDRPVKPAGPAAIAPPPALTAAAAVPSENTLVIAGLNPSTSVEVPAPPGSVRSSFSGGPKAQPKGGEGALSGALLEVPSLTIQGGAKEPQPPVMVAAVSPTSPAALAAAFRATHGAAPPTVGSTPRAARVSSAPDPRMYGRQVYTMAIQIPNLTSYYGSWLVWFAEHEPDIGNPRVDLRPPLPLRMVDPKYIPSAADERVEGKVRLWAVIGKDGHMADISLLQHLDDRLDRSAEEALGKWLFQPAMRNGAAIDVDAVFEIPFYAAPKNDR